ncbi:MAG: phosphoribosyltransferase family protein [Aureibaculum sp.]
MFTNRKQAGILLAKELKQYQNKADVVVVTIPRGGVPVGFEISQALHLPLELVLSKKIGHPFNKEYAIGAVTLKSSVLSEAAEEVSHEYIEDEIERIRDLLQQRYDWYYDGKKPLELENMIVILVDDGIATGNTLLSSIQLIEQEEPKEIIIALPVAPPSALNKIRELRSVSRVICILETRNFHAVGQFYEEFNQVSDEEVIALLKKANNKLPLKTIED